MVKMQHPFQLVASVKRQETREPKHFLLAACGPKLVSVSLQERRVVAKWPAEEAAVQCIKNGEGEDGERPAKKHKTAANGNAKSPPSPNIIKLVTSPNQDYVAVVTDDKCVHVFTIGSDGSLNEVNQRIMPKRPCAIKILPDNDTLIVGDKFGDVYSLPLVPVSTGENENINPEQPAEGDTVTPKSGDKPAFKSAATTLTVHSKRNRKALEAQQQQKNFTPRKEALQFEHKLLLGHVSMLTDAVFAIKEVDGVRRGHIITADRDEHIRVSRGPPQAHIIEGYCLGHTEYISKLCLIPGTDILISGGGDAWLGIWDWPKHTLRRKFWLLDDVLDQPVATGQEKREQEKRVNVSGLWAVEYSAYQSSTHTKQEPALAVALEEKSMLLIIPISILQTKIKERHTVHQLPAPPLDVTTVDDLMIITMDSRTDGESRTQALKLNLPEGKDHDNGLLEVTVYEEIEAKIKCLTDEIGTAQEVDGKALDGLLYGVADLRKRRGAAEGGDEKDIEADEGAREE